MNSTYFEVAFFMIIPYIAKTCLWEFWMEAPMLNTCDNVTLLQKICILLVDIFPTICKHIEWYKTLNDQWTLHSFWCAWETGCGIHGYCTILLSVRQVPVLSYPTEHAQIFVGIMDFPLCSIIKWIHQWISLLTNNGIVAGCAGCFVKFWKFRIPEETSLPYLMKVV